MTDGTLKEFNLIGICYEGRMVLDRLCVVVEEEEVKFE